MYANIAATPGATFTPAGQGTNSVVGTYAWTPTVNDIGDHTIIISSEDSTCTGTGFSLVLKTLPGSACESSTRYRCRSGFAYLPDQ